MKKIISLLIIGFFVVFLNACQKNENTIVVGTMSQPGEPILKAIKEDFEKKGYKLKLQLFTDFAPINTALKEKTIHANLFQHEAYLNTYNQNNGTDLIVAKKLYLPVYGIYSKKINRLSDLPDNVKVTLPDDASNLTRSLKILEQAGLITVKKNAILTLDSVLTNPKKLKLVTMSSSLLAQTLNDTDGYLSVVNATFAIQANLTNTANFLFKEEGDLLTNANILAARKEDQNEQWLIDLIDSLTSSLCREYIEETYKETIIPVF